MSYIPNIIHFVYGLTKHFGGKPFNIINYLSIKSAFEVNKPEKIFFYYCYEPNGYWWNLVQQYITPIKIIAPDSVYGRKLCHYAHQADIIRLHLLYRFGGIYLDMDTICIKPFTPLRHNKLVLGVQGKDEGLCNAVILASKGSIFLKAWLENYTNFQSKGKDQYWSDHSVGLPLYLSMDRSLKKEVQVVPYDYFFYPLYTLEGLTLLFEKASVFKNAYCYHLWESMSYKKYLSKINEKNILKNDTTYNLVARTFIKNTRLPRIFKGKKNHSRYLKLYENKVHIFLE
jgi:hypothetical protein